MTDKTKLEAMLVHLLNEKGPTGRQWKTIQVEGFPMFSRDDVRKELANVRTPIKWYQFWKQ